MTAYIKAPFIWVYNKWIKFNEWVASILPGWKTKITLALGALGTAAAAFQEFFTGLPLADVLKTLHITAEQVTLMNLFLYSMAYWFKGLSK